MLKYLSVPGDTWGVALTWWKMVWRRLIVLFISQRIPKTNDCISFRIDSSTFFWRYCYQMNKFSEKKTADHLFRKASCAMYFCWICLVIKHPYRLLLFTFRLIRTDIWPNTRYNLTSFEVLSLYFFENLFAPINTSIVQFDWTMEFYFQEFFKKNTIGPWKWNSIVQSHGTYNLAQRTNNIDCVKSVYFERFTYRSLGSLVRIFRVVIQYNKKFR